MIIEEYIIREQFTYCILDRVRRMPAIKNVIENIQFKDLDQNHVVPNMGPITERGIWYPNLLGY